MEDMTRIVWTFFTSKVLTDTAQVVGVGYVAYGTQAK